ncbi:MAG: hypothetical protein ABSC56_11410 [Solirubrobacteraceae bacterium]
MTALLLVLALFAAAWLVGLAVLAVVKADTTNLRVTLTAPALGTATIMLTAFAFSYAGMAVDHFAAPVTVALLVLALTGLVVRKPTVDRRALAVIAVCLVGLALVARLFLDYGFNWDSAGNDDMANYSSLALLLMHHALLAPLDVHGYLTGRDYATVFQSLHNKGSRPGVDLMLALIASVTGRLPYEVFMPFIAFLQLTLACSAGALSLQAARRWWAAPIAAGLLWLSPEATFGWLQQLLSQAAGLSTAAALLALLLHRDLFATRRWPRASESVPIGLLAAGLVLGYVELASTIAIAIALFLAIGLARRRLEPAATLRLLLVVGLIVVVVLNGYLVREVTYVYDQSKVGFASGGPPIFAFTLIPQAVAEIVGLRAIPGEMGILNASSAIVLALVILGGLMIGAVIGALRGSAAATVLVADAAFGLLLGHDQAAFGLYKLYMYVQPFVCAAAAGWLTLSKRRWLLGLGFAGLAALVVLQWPIFTFYVNRSRDPVDLAGASQTSLMPAFRRLVTNSRRPIVSVTDNPTLTKLESESAGARQLYFISFDPFTPAHTLPWASRSFALLEPHQSDVDTFGDNARASTLLNSHRCELVMPSGSETVVNRTVWPAGSPYLVHETCSSAKNQLVFTASQLGQSYYLVTNASKVAMWQTEADPYYPGKTFAGVGRYMLFRVLGPTRGMRLELDLTTTLLHNNSNELAPGFVIGRSRLTLPLVGHGSARVFSAPLQPQIIDGQPYILLDLVRTPAHIPAARSGVQGLWDGRIPIDYRELDGWLRNVSLVSAQQYRALRPPTAIATFPAGLANPSLQYSGIYEDGWIGPDAYAVLAGGQATHLKITGEVPAGAGGTLNISVNGHTVYSAAAGSGALAVDVPLPATTNDRTISLHFSKMIHLAAPDGRPASALLTFLGLTSR